MNLTQAKVVIIVRAPNNPTKQTISWWYIVPGKIFPKWPINDQ